MWKWEIDELESDRCRRYRLHAASGPADFGQVLSLLRSDRALRTFFAQTLARCPFPAFRWEAPPVTAATGDRPFEFVLLRCDALDRPVDRAAFAAQFAANPDELAMTFPNLAGDAVLVVPGPCGPLSAYGHLASFVRGAPPEQVDRLWQVVGEAMGKRISEQPVWLSTAGMGVAWLHVRLDDRPKYYGYRPYALNGHG